MYAHLKRFVVEAGTNSHTKFLLQIVLFNCVAVNSSGHGSILFLTMSHPVWEKIFTAVVEKQNISCI